MTERRQIAAVLSAAFAHEPLLGWLLRADQWSAWARGRYFGFLVERVVPPLGRAALSPSGAGAIVWMPSQWPRVTWRLRLELALEWPRWTGLARRTRARRAYRLARQHWPAAPLAHILFLGVDPDRRQPREAESLVELCLRDIDQRRLGALFETSNAAMARAARRYDFSVAATYELPEQGPKMWVLLRAPRSREV